MSPMVLFLRLPTLHPELARCSASTGSVTRSDSPVSLWPGLPGMPETGWWSPKYPFAPDEARACLADIHAMGEAALSGVPLQALAARDASPAAARAAAESEALTRFARTGVVDEPGDISEAPDSARRAAQKALLWAWLLEERALELRALTQSYAVRAARLADALGGEREERDAMPDSATLDAPAEAHPAEDPDLLPPWRVVLENAVLFMPGGTHIAVDSPEMSADLCDALHIVSAAGTETIVEAPVWRALGRSAPRPGCPWQKTSLRFVLWGKC